MNTKFMFAVFSVTIGLFILMFLFFGMVANLPLECNASVCCLSGIFIFLGLTGMLAYSLKKAPGEI
ncbi:hypothetical protein KO465_08645 [Candidatus Micrarchaeota archaeon]|nr:hypothetical protein [Candidatus Micrarchaeota archaeon]